MYLFIIITLLTDFISFSHNMGKKFVTAIFDKTTRKKNNLADILLTLMSSKQKKIGRCVFFIYMFTNYSVITNLLSSFNISFFPDYLTSFCYNEYIFIFSIYIYNFSLINRELSVLNNLFSFFQYI